MKPNKKKKICPHCKKGKLAFVKGNEPWNIDHYQCEKCDSTYCTWEIDDENTPT